MSEIDGSAPPRAVGATAASERHTALDVLRGVALLGILPMNVQAMAMPGAAYNNPASYGDLDGINRVVWIVSHVLTDMKMMALFSMLFGAGICIFAERAASKRGTSTGLHYRRNFILLLIGLTHGWLLFHGDILVHYALCSFWLYWMRNRSPRTLAIVGGLMMCVPIVVFALGGFAAQHMPPADAAKIAEGWLPPPDKISEAIAGMRGSFVDQLRTRAPLTLALETFVFAIFFFWRISALMLLGMALYKTGFLVARLDDRSYARIALVTLPCGFAMVIAGVVVNFENAWAFPFSMFHGVLPNYVGSLAVAIGYASLIMIAVRRNVFAPVLARLAAVGRMAFTNYLAHSVLAVAVFNFGGLFGAERWQQAIFVVTVWSAQLLWSAPWLARFEYGPVEWLWRAATYGAKPRWRR